MSAYDAQEPKFSMVTMSAHDSGSRPSSCFLIPQRCEQSAACSYCCAELCPETVSRNEPLPPEVASYQTQVPEAACQPLGCRRTVNTERWLPAKYCAPHCPPGWGSYPARTLSVIFTHLCLVSTPSSIFVLCAGTSLCCRCVCHTNGPWYCS